jgi:hypothetical protein
VCESKVDHPVSESATLGGVPLDADALELDWKVCDGYIAYSSELLRVSLLAIGGLAALSLKVHETDTPVTTLPISVFERAFIVLVIAAGLSLLHRYIANDSMAFHIEALRRRKRDRPELKVDGKIIAKSDLDLAIRQEVFRKWLFRLSNWTLIGSAAALIIGIGLAVSAMQRVSIIPAGH